MLLYNEDILEALDQAWLAHHRVFGRNDARPVFDRFQAYAEAEMRPHTLGDLIMGDENYKYRKTKPKRGLR